MLNFLIDRLSAGSVLAASLLAYLVFFFIRDYIRDRQITALGGRAPIAKYRIPLGLLSMFTMTSLVLMLDGSNRFRISGRYSEFTMQSS